MLNRASTYIILFAFVVDALAECQFHLNQHVPKTSILIQNTPPSGILYPNHINVIKVPTGSKIKLTCGDKYLNRNFKKSKKPKHLVLRCNNKDIVNTQGERVHLSELECEDFPTSTVQKNTRRGCYNNSTLYNIGYHVCDSNFVNVIRACFDHLQQDSVYTWYDSSMLSTGHQSGVSRPNFVLDGLYTFPVDKAYGFGHQRARFAEILNSKELAEKYIKHDRKHFLARGHLSAKADFVYGAEQSATFHYINAAPQWQVFNEGNWEKVETAVRDEIKQKSESYRVVTGTHGVATLPDVNNVEKELYLHVDENNNPALKVPKFYWKIVYDMNKKTGVTIIGVNNPFLKSVPSDYLICTDICDQITWLPRFSDDLSKGYIYCCRMNEFLNATGMDTAFIES